jgi:hypothetical protein
MSLGIVLGALPVLTIIAYILSFAAAFMLEPQGSIDRGLDPSEMGVKRSRVQSYYAAGLLALVATVSFSVAV